MPVDDKKLGDDKAGISVPGSDRPGGASGGLKVSGSQGNNSVPKDTAGFSLSGNSPQPPSPQPAISLEGTKPNPSPTPAIDLTGKAPPTLKPGGGKKKTESNPDDEFTNLNTIVEGPKGGLDTSVEDDDKDNEKKNDKNPIKKDINTDDSNKKELELESNVNSIPEAMGGIRNSANKVRKFLSEHGPKIIETVAGKANNAALQEQIQQGARVIKRAWEGSNWKQILGKDRKSQGNAAQATGNAAQDTGNVAQATDNSAQATGNVAQQFSNVTEQFGNTSQSAASSPTQGAETAGKNFTPALHQLSKYAPKLKALVKPEIKPELSFSDLSKNNADENKATTPRRPSGP